MPVADDTLPAHTRFSCDPIFTSKNIVFVQDQSYGGASYGPRPQSSYSMMPVLLADEKNSQTHVQQFISDQLLNQALETIFDEGRLTLRKNVTSKFIDSFVDNFERVYGEHDDIELEIMAIQAPNLDIDTWGSTISTVLQVRVMNPFARDEGYEAFKMNVNFYAEPLLMIKITSNKLTASLKNTTLHVDSLHGLFYTKTTVDKINNHDSLSKLAELIADGVNDRFFDDDLGL